MRYLRRQKMFIILAILIIYLFSGTIAHAEDADRFYLIFRNDGSNHVTLELGTQKVLYDDALDSVKLDNLEIMPLDVGMHYSFSSESSDLQSLITEARKYLLSYGYARLVNTEIASESELNYQQQAQNQKLGIWASFDMPPVPPSEPSPTPAVSGGDGSEAEAETVPEWVKAIGAFFTSHGRKILSFLAGCGFLSFVAGAIIRWIRTRRKKIYLGGCNAAGKTTLRKSLLNPDVSYADLLRQSPTLALETKRIIRDDTNRKITLKAILLDPPGHELEHAMDQLALTWWKRLFRQRNIIIIVVAPTKGYKVRNEIDQAYIEDQWQSIQKFWRALIKSHKTITPEAVVMFINKLDLYDEESEVNALFDRHKGCLQEVCRGLRVPFYCISGSIPDKSGMTELKEIIIQRRRVRYVNGIHPFTGRRRSK